MSLARVYTERTKRLTKPKEETLTNASFTNQHHDLAATELRAQEAPSSQFSIPEQLRDASLIPLHMA